MKRRVIFREIYDYAVIVEAKSELECQEKAETIIYGESNYEKADPKYTYSGDGEVFSERVE